MSTLLREGGIFTVRWVFGEDIVYATDDDIGQTTEQLILSSF